MERVQLGRLTLQPGRQLLADGKRVPITRRALEVLSVLAEAGGELVTKDELMAAVWPDMIVEDNALQAQIAALRKALGKNAKYLRTVRGIGYQLELSAPAGHPAEAADRPSPSLVVLPFTNMSGEGEQEYFADGITEDIITDLSKVSALRVIARNSAFTLKGQNVDVTEVALRFGVTHVLEGSVRKDGGRVRISAQLVDGSDGGHVWAERYDRDLQNIFDLQDEVAEAIASALKVELKPAEREAIEDRGTDNLEAYDLYLRARSLYGRFGTEFSERSVALAREAIKVDPGFVQAYRQLAASLDQLQFLMPDRGAEIRHERQALIERVSEIAPNDPFFVLMRVRKLVCDGDLVEAERLNATVPSGTYLGSFWACPEFFGFYVGRFRQVLELARQRARLDPMDPFSSIVLHDLLDINGLLDEADIENERRRDLPGDLIYFELSSFLRGKGRAPPEELTARYRKILACEPFASTMPLLGQLEPVLHDPEAARECIRQAVSDPSCQDSLKQLWIAALAAYYDDADLTLEILHRVFVERDHVVDHRCFMWLTSPFGQVHRDPRFKDIVRELGLYEYWRQTGEWGDFARPVGDDDFEVIS